MKKKTENSLTFGSVVRTLTIKAYLEQMPDLVALLREWDSDALGAFDYDLYVERAFALGIEDENERNAKVAAIESQMHHYTMDDFDTLSRYAEKVRCAFENWFIPLVNNTGCDYACNWHFMDFNPVKDSIREFTHDKLHVHMAFRFKTPVRILSVLKQLKICFTEKDDLLFKNAVDTIRTDWTQCVAYMTHESAGALAQHKTIYPRTLVQHNIIDFDDIVDRASGKTRIDNVGGSWDELDLIARNMGLEMKPYDPYSLDLPFQMKSQRTNMKTLEETYNRALNKRLSECPIMPRCAVYIYGDAGCGKSHGVTRFLSANGIKTAYIAQEGTGKFDTLTIDTLGVVFDDIYDLTLNELKSIGEGVVFRPHRRNSAGSAVFACEYVFITANVPIDKYLQELGIRDEDAIAVKSRFYVMRAYKSGSLDMVSKPFRNPLFKNDLDAMAQNAYNYISKSMAELKALKDSQLQEQAQKPLPPVAEIERLFKPTYSQEVLPIRL